ncbi:sigma-70 family RNA polymerase sigma factor [Ornithinibacillus sp. 179-J 7C1 HS]|uniref:sigma-70 family RNA polymerase sigma factor n=1 Tax=Ornithinibacillus sp. 179-J 7C1 HS TaxID=3142384 RepID=UPI00399FB3A4
MTRQLVRKAKKGDKASLLKLIMDQKDDYYKIAFSYMGNKHDALDAMEDMIVKLYENIGQLKNNDAFYSWSKKILVNCCYSIYRKRTKVVLVDEWQENLVNTSDSNQEHDQVEHQMEIQDLLTMINPRQAEAIKLRYLNDLEYQSIADLTNTSIGTVKSRIFNGLKKLNKIVGGARHE